MLWTFPRDRCSILVATAAIVSTSSGFAAQLEWIGGTDNSWHTPINWAPIEEPGGEPIQRVPQEGDAVVILDTTHGSTVRLEADSALLESLVLGNGFELKTSNHVLNVAGSTTLVGSGTMLAVAPRLWQSSHLPAFHTAHLQIGDGATVQLQDAALHVKEQARIDPGGELGGYGDFIFGEEGTPDGTVVLINDGTLGTVRTNRPFRFGSAWFTAQGGALLDFDGLSEQGIIDLDRTERVAFSSDASLADPYNGPLSIRAGDSFRSYSGSGPFTFEDARISIDGGPDYTTAASIGGDILIEGNSTVTIEPGVADIDGSFRMLGGTFRSFGNVTMQTSDVPATGGLSDKYFGPESKFLLEDGSSLYLPGFSNTASLHVQSQEIDLDGDNGDVVITIGLWSSLRIEAPAIDNDPSSPGFDGTFHIEAGSLTIEVPGGWVLDGRLEFSDSSFRGSGAVHSTSITVDGGEPDDGIFVGVGDVDSQSPPTIHADVTLTEKGRIGVQQYGLLSVKGRLSLDGTLEYILVPAFNEKPSIGTVETLITAESGITGRFASHDFFPLPPDRAWLVEYRDQSVALRVIETISGEYNANGTVEQADLDLVLLNWGQSATPPPTGWVNDLPDGIIDQAELDRVLLGWGDRASRSMPRGGGAVPEPASWIIGLLMSGFIWSAGLAHRISAASRSP